MRYRCEWQGSSDFYGTRRVLKSACVHSHCYWTWLHRWSLVDNTSMVVYKLRKWIKCTSWSNTIRYFKVTWSTCHSKTFLIKETYQTCYNNSWKTRVPRHWPTLIDPEGLQWRGRDRALRATCAWCDLFDLNDARMTLRRGTASPAEK